MHKQYYYHILGLNQNASEQDIKKAFIRLAFQYHPDINPGSENEEKFNEVYEAYAALRGEAKRRKYDRDLSLEGILYDILEVSRDASEQDINRATTKLVARYRSLLDLGRGDGEKLEKIYKAYTVLRAKARRRGYDRFDEDASNQPYVEDELSFDLALEDTLKELARQFGLSFDEKSIDPLGVLPLGREIVSEVYKVGEQLLGDVLGIRVRGRARGRRLF